MGIDRVLDYVRNDLSRHFACTMVCAGMVAVAYIAVMSVYIVIRPNFRSRAEFVNYAYTEGRSSEARMENFGTIDASMGFVSNVSNVGRNAVGGDLAYRLE